MVSVLAKLIGMDILVKLPFSSFGGWSFLVISKDAWDGIVEVYQNKDSCSYDLEDDDGDELTIDLCDIVMRAEIIDASDQDLELLKSAGIADALHDEKMFDILCENADEDALTRKISLASQEVMDVIRECTGVSNPTYDLLTLKIDSNLLVVPIFDQSLNIIQEYDHYEDETTYIIAIGDRQTVVVGDEYIPALKEFLTKECKEIRSRMMEEIPDFNSVLAESNDAQLPGNLLELLKKK